MHEQMPTATWILLIPFPPDATPVVGYKQRGQFPKLLLESIIWSIELFCTVHHHQILSIVGNRLWSLLVNWLAYFDYLICRYLFGNKIFIQIINLDQFEIRMHDLASYYMSETSFLFLVYIQPVYLFGRCDANIWCAQHIFEKNAFAVCLKLLYELCVYAFRTTR